jgi:uncharacterized protein YndB with AHSA1/START domain
MNKTTVEAPPRAFEMSIDLPASPEQVWRALTMAEELVRWFPLDARVTPGAGGSMVWSWGENWDWDTRIEVWEPGRLLRLVQDDARPYDLSGRPMPEGQAAPARIAIEFTLESHQGKTRLRLIHSGFGRGAAWDDEVEGITEGWQAELASLRHYLARHSGRDRDLQIAWLLPGGERLSGTVALHLPAQTLAGTVRELDDGWFRILTWSVPGGTTGVWAGLATYFADHSRVREFKERADQALRGLFPS